MMEESAASIMEERKDILALAQQKLDSIDRESLGLSSRPGSTSSGKRRQRNPKLLSTLLYVALMSHKLEDMKTMLEEVDPSTYMEWRSLLDTLHSPEFHAQERRIQNRKVKLTFERKRRYKEEATRLEKELAATTDRLMALQKNMSETTNLMSKSISVLQEERAALVSVVEEGRCQIKETNKKVDDLRMEAARNDAKAQSLHSALGSANLLLADRNRSITELEIKLSQSKQDAIFATNDANNARSALEDARAQLKACESKHAGRCAVFQQDLSDVRSSNAVLNVKLEAAQSALDAALQRLDDCRKVIAQTNNLKEIVQKGISKLDENMTQSGSLIESSRDDLRTLLSHSKDISDKLSIASDAASDNATSIESRLGQLQEVVSTLSSSTLLKTFSDEVQTGLLNVKRTVDDLLEHHKRSIINVQQRLDDVTKLQQNDSLRQRLQDENAQKQLGVIIELQRSNTVEAEVANVAKQLKDLITVQSNELTDVVRGGISKLDENMTQSGSLIETSRDDLRTLLSRSKDISDKLSIASDAASDNATSIESRLGQLQEVVSTLSSSTLLKSFSDEVQTGLLNVKQTVDDLMEHNKSSVIKVQQRLDDVSKLQQNDSLRQQIRDENAQKQLGVIIELQRSNTVEAEVANVAKQLKDLITGQSNELTDVVRGGISKLDENMTQSGSLIETSRDDLRTLLSHSKDISDKLSIASDAASDNATSIESRLGQLQEVVSTLSSSTLLKSFSDEVQTGLLNVKRTVDDLLEHHKSSFINVQQRLDDVTKLQQNDSLRQQIRDENAQKQLGVIIELQRSNTVEAEVANVAKQLKDLITGQSNELTDVVRGGISKLDENMTQSGSLIETSRDDLRTLLSHSKDISDKLSIASDAASDNATSIESRLGQLQEVVSTLSSSTLLKSFSDEVQTGLLNVKRTVDDLLEHNKSSVIKVQQRLDDVSKLQQNDSLRQQIRDENAQKQLGVIIELQKNNTVEAEVANVAKQLKDLITGQSNELTDVVRGGISKLDENMTQSGSLIETSRDDLRTLLSRSKDISDKLSIASDAASDNATSIESRLGQLQEVVSTLSSSTLLKSFSDEVQTGLLNVKRTVDDLFEHHKSSIINVQQRLDDVSKLQQNDSLRQQIRDENAQKQLGVIIELQRSNTVEAEVANVAKQLKDLITGQSNELTDVVRGGISKLDENMTQSGSLIETSRDDLRTLLSRSKDISDKLSIASDAASDNATSIESRLGQLQEVVSTLSSSTLLKSFSDEVQTGLLNVKRTVDDLFEHHKSSVINVQQRLDDVSKLQQNDSLRQQIRDENAQKQLGVIIELQRSNTVEAEVANVAKQLKDLITVQSNELTDVVRGGISKLDENMTQSGSLIETSRDDLRTLLSRSKDISDKLSIASDAASDNATSIESRLGQLQEVVSTLSSSTLLKSFSDEVQTGLLNVKRTVDDLLEHHKSSVINVQQRLDDVLKFQQNESLRQIRADELADSIISQALLRHHQKLEGSATPN